MGSVDLHFEAREPGYLPESGVPSKHSGDGAVAAPAGISPLDPSLPLLRRV